MKNILIILLSGFLLSSCSTAYRTAQTPDDVYYSPAEQVKERTRVERKVTRDDYYDRDEALYRMRLNDYRFNRLDAYWDYDYNPYNYGYNGYYYNPHYYSGPVYSTGFHYGYYAPGMGYYPNSYYHSPFYSSPYYYYGAPQVIIRTPTNSTIRSTNLGAYNNNNTNVRPSRIIRPSDQPAREIRRAPRQQINTRDYRIRQQSTDYNTNRSYEPSRNTTSPAPSGNSSGGSIGRPQRNN